jgi:hypothetical protein
MAEQQFLNAYYAYTRVLLPYKYGLNLVFEWDWRANDINHFYDKEFAELYPDTRAAHYTTCKPFGDTDCVTKTQSGLYWLDMNEKANADLKIYECDRKEEHDGVKTASE